MPLIGLPLLEMLAMGLLFWVFEVLIHNYIETLQWLNGTKINIHIELYLLDIFHLFFCKVYAYLQWGLVAVSFHNTIIMKRKLSACYFIYDYSNNILLDIIIIILNILIL